LRRQFADGPFDVGRSMPGKAVSNLDKRSTFGFPLSTALMVVPDHQRFLNCLIAESRRLIAVGRPSFLDRGITFLFRCVERFHAV
jgi:hypothetical protein